VYVDRWISEISQTFGDAALDEQDTYLPEALLDRVSTLYALDLTTRVIIENQIALNNLLALKDFMTRLAVSSTTLSLSSQPVQPTTMGAPHAAQHSAPLYCLHLSSKLAHQRILQKLRRRSLPFHSGRLRQDPRNS
jgi:hypothetical protein